MIENGKAVSIISKNGTTGSGWYYDESQKILWIKGTGKNTSDNEWQISLN
ncbi:MAG: hypothetical protein NVSMB45_15540 [Ginsengibacter sp.]